MPQPRVASGGALPGIVTAEVLSAYFDIYISIYPPPCPRHDSGVPPVWLVPCHPRLECLFLGPTHPALGPCRILPHDFLFDQIFHRFLITPKITKGPPKPPKNIPKRYPLETISDCFGGAGGNSKIMVSPWRNHRFHGLRGFPGTSCAALCARYFSMWFSQRFVYDL